MLPACIIAIMLGPWIIFSVVSFMCSTEYIFLRAKVKVLCTRVIRIIRKRIKRLKRH